MFLFGSAKQGRGREVRNSGGLAKAQQVLAPKRGGSLLLPVRQGQKPKTPQKPHGWVTSSRNASAWLFMHPSSGLHKLRSKCRESSMGQDWAHGHTRLVVPLFCSLVKGTRTAGLPAMRSAQHIRIARHAAYALL